MALLIVASFLSSLAADIDTLYGRLYTQFQGPGASVDTINTWLSSLGTNGMWPDVDYASKVQTNWPPMTHLNRTLSMAQAFRNSTHTLYNSAAVRTGFLSAFDGWIARDPQSYNWWYNQISTQLTIAPCMILMKDQLSKARLDSGNVILARSWSIHGNQTGQNLVWVSKITIWRGCIMDSVSLITPAVAAITGTIVVTANEGIQKDASFHQHGPQLYCGGYGLEFSKDCSEMAVLWRGTKFALPQAKLDILDRYILDGQQWIMRGTMLDYSVIGRGITKIPLYPDKKMEFVTICDNMGLSSPSRSNEYIAFANRLNSWPAASETTPIGNRHFWNSDFMVHQRGAHYASVRMSSTRTISTEIVNSEGLKSYYLGDGVCYVYRTGREYVNIFPIWDWTRLPGVTCQHQAAPPGVPSNFRGTTGFVGGVSDGSYGATGLDYSRDGVAGRKAWFFFDREIIGLGAGITCQSTIPVYTSINQCLSTGPVTIGSAQGTATASAGTRRLSTASWIHHDGVGYVFPTVGDSVTMRCDTQSGKWSSINLSQPSTKITDTVFSVWFDHGAGPLNASYAYGIVPGVSAGEMTSYSRSFAAICRVVSNDTAVQAVRNDSLGVTGMVFYNSGSVTVAAATSITVDRPCIALLRERSDSVSLAVSNPLNAACTVHVSLSVQLQGPGATWNASSGMTRIDFVLPGGLDAGSSVVKRLARNPTAALPGQSQQMRAPLIRTAHHTVFFVRQGASAEGNSFRSVKVFSLNGKLIAGSVAPTAASIGGMNPGLRVDASGVFVVQFRSDQARLSRLVPLAQ